MEENERVASAILSTISTHPTLFQHIQCKNSLLTDIFEYGYNLYQRIYREINKYESGYD